MNKDKVIDSAYEFIHGGDSFAGKAGWVLGRLFRGFVKWSVIAFFTLAVVIVGQMTQYSAAVDSVRVAYLSSWAENNSERLEQISAYERGCHGPLDKSMNEPLLRLVSIHECAEVAGSKELADVLRSADSAVEAVAPMSWF